MSRYLYYPGALGMIDKQRRGWEDAMEKAEQMSQIFDSLIITSTAHCSRLNTVYYTLYCTLCTAH